MIGKLKRETRRSIRRTAKRTKNAVWIYNNGQYEQETICAEKWMRLIYGNPVAGAPLLFLLKRKAVSRLYGMYCRTPLSARKIDKFIRHHQIDMTGFNEPFRTYEDFFTREKSDIVFPADAHVLGSPCEGLASAYVNIDADKMISAKSDTFSLAELFGDSELARVYEGGTMLRIRLTPANYHRIHFFDDGKITDEKHLNGNLFSVSPLALKRITRLYCRNKRALVKFSSQNFGDVALVEVGATFVGSIVHCFENGDDVSRGQQAAFFKPGGSLLLMFFRKGAFTPMQYLLDQTDNGYETKVMIGEILGFGAGGIE